MGHFKAESPSSPTFQWNFAHLFSGKVGCLRAQTARELREASTGVVGGLESSQASLGQVLFLCKAGKQRLMFLVAGVALALKDVRHVRHRVGTACCHTPLSAWPTESLALEMDRWHKKVQCPTP